MEPGDTWLSSSWLDARLGFRLLVRNWGLTLAGGLAMTLAIGIAAIVFAAFDVILWSALPLEEGDRVVAIQVWDREAGRRRDTTWPRALSTRRAGAGAAMFADRHERACHADTATRNPA